MLSIFVRMYAQLCVWLGLPNEYANRAYKSLDQGPRILAPARAAVGRYRR